MSRLFCHIAEFELDGYEMIPAMMLAGERVMLWAPSASQLEAARESSEDEPGLIDPNTLLELVRRDKLQVLGRRDWLTDPDSRAAHPWPHARWVGYYDDEIAKIGLNEEDDEVRPEQRKVRFFDPEDGREWAKEEVERGTARANDARALLDARQLPKGMLEKAAREAEGAADPESAEVAAVLRDLYNHEEALRLCGANAPVTFGFRALLGLQTLPFPGAGERPRPPDWLDDEGLEDVDEERLLELLELATSFTKPRTVDELAKLVERDDIDDLRREMWQLTAARGDLAIELERRIEKGAPGLTRRDPSLFAEKGSLPRLILSVALWGVLDRAPLGLVPTFAPEAMHPARRILEMGSVLSWSEYDGPRWPFVLAYDRSSPMYLHLSELVDHLRRHFGSRAG